jgi:hypothetical protein
MEMKEIRIIQTDKDEEGEAEGNDTDEWEISISIPRSSHRKCSKSCSE